MPLDGAQVLGWYDENTLLMSVEMRRVVVYDLTTGEPAQVTTIAGKRSWLSVADRGLALTPASTPTVAP